MNLSQQTEALAQAIAEARRVPVDIAIRDALVAQPLSRRPRDASPEAIARRSAAFAHLSAIIAELPVLDGRPVQEIVDDIHAR